MSDEPDDLVIQVLRAIRGDIAKIDDRLDELTNRLGRIERLVADLRVQGAEHSIRMDRMSQRIERIERRFDLVDAPR